MNLHAVILLLSAAVLVWQNRSLLSEGNQPEGNAPGSGDRAARFASALLLLLAGLATVTLSLVPAWQNNADINQTAGLLQQLALYAALPLLVFSGLARALDQDWSRMVWGRILLGICAVFALTRNSEWLDYWMLLVLLAGALTFALPVIRRREFSFIAVLLFWLALSAGYLGLDLRSNLNHNPAVWSWLGLTLIPYLICSNRWLSLRG